MRRSAALWRAYLPEEFIYKKLTKKGLKEETQVVTRAHVFQLNRQLCTEMDAAADFSRALQITIIPTCQYAYPSFWGEIEKLVTSQQHDSVFCEGFTGQYARRGVKLLKHDRMMTDNLWRRWRQQRAPWPWHFLHPTKIHGGDSLDYSPRQRLWPHWFQPAASPEQDKERIDRLWKQMREVTPIYHSHLCGIAFQHRFCPAIAERLEAEGYILKCKIEIEAASTVNEAYGMSRRTPPSLGSPTTHRTHIQLQRWITF